VNLGLPLRVRGRENCERHAHWSSHGGHVKEVQVNIHYSNIIVVQLVGRCRLIIHLVAQESLHDLFFPLPVTTTCGRSHTQLATFFNNNLFRLLQSHCNCVSRPIIMFDMPMKALLAHLDCSILGSMFWYICMGRILMDSHRHITSTPGTAQTSFNLWTYLHSRIILLKAGLADISVPSAASAIHLVRVVQSSNLTLPLDELKGESCEISLVAVIMCIQTSWISYLH